MPERYASEVGVGLRLRWAKDRVIEVARAEGPVAAARQSGAYALRRAQGVRGYHSAPRRLPSTPLSHAAARRWPESVTILATQPGLPQCLRYRVHQKVEIADSLGVGVHVANPLNFREARSLIQLSRALIVYREPWTRDLEALVAEARRLGQPVVYEVDDLVYRGSVIAQSPNLSTLPRDLRRAVVKGADQYLRALRMSDHALASTAPLAQDMAKEVPGRGFVVENGIDSEAMVLLSSIEKDPRPVRWPGVPGDAVLIAYGTGSRAHDSDLDLASPALADVMVRDPRVWLLLIGPVRVPDALGPVVNRVIRAPLAPLGEYLRCLASADIVIAPLQADGFNIFKSHVKYLEAGLLSRPFVGSSTVYGDYVRGGQTGLIARSTSEWVGHLDSLVASEALRRTMGSAAREHVGQWATTAGPAEEFAAMLEHLGFEVGVRCES